MSLYPEGLPGQVLPVTSQDTYASVGAPLTVVGSGGGGGGGVQSVTSGLNISTSGTATNPVVFMRSDLFNLSSISFGNLGQGQINNLSTINGAAYPPAAGSVPANLAVSTLSFPAGQGQLINVSTVNGAVYPPPAGSVPANLELSSLTVATNANITSTLFVSSILGRTGYNNSINFLATDGDEANESLKLIGFFGSHLLLDGRNASFQFKSANSSAEIIADGDTGNITINNGLQIASGGAKITLPVNQGQLVNVSTVNGAPYGTAVVPANPLFSTIQLSTITTPTNPAGAPTSSQTLNVVIGGMRLQAGIVYCTNTATTISWATAFTTVPIVLTGTTGSTGNNTIVIIQGGGENSAQFSVNTATVTGIYWLAIGAA